jgi:deoxyribonuclease-4
LEQVVAAFRQRSEETGIVPAFLHGTYLMNFGSPDAALLERSIGALAASMECAARIGALGVIFHSGSHMGAGYEAVMDQEVAALVQVLERSPSGPWLVIENAAGMGNHIGAGFAEIGRIMKGVGDPRVKVCLDTAHTLAAGYDIAHPDGLERTVEEFDREIGLANLVAFHANDSKIPLGGGVDRHENIGEGHIGTEGFGTLLSHPAFRDVPFLLEVPGFEGNGPDRENVERLKAIRARVGAG